MEKAVANDTVRPGDAADWQMRTLFDAEVAQAIDYCIERLEDRVDRIREVVEFGGSVVRGITMAPPPLEKPDPGDAPDEEETAGALEEGLGDVPVEVEVDVSADCLPFDPQALRLERDGERFLMTDGRSRLKLFRDAREARRALRLIRRYEMGCSLLHRTTGSAPRILSGG